MTTTPEVPKDYSLKEVAALLGMSERWIRARLKETEHQRYGSGPNAKVKFTPEQVEKLRAAHTKQPIAESITTGRRRRSA